MSPRVSICLPVLNGRKYLETRVETILAQTFDDYEVFVLDGYSSDGSWEYLQKKLGGRPNVRLHQSDSEGPYPAFNECIRRTQGEFIYFATADDSMAPDFLERTLRALEQNPECELAHVPLRLLNEEGVPVEDQSWPSCTVFAAGRPELAQRPHLRMAPYDGLLHLTGQHVCLSLTQLLIRRTLFAGIGYFQNEWGSNSDFNWEMRAGFSSNLVHVPETWASWRLHSEQLSASVDLGSQQHAQRFEAMIDDALEFAEVTKGVTVSRQLLLSLQARRRYYSVLRQRRNELWRRRLKQLSMLLFGSSAIRKEVFSRVMSAQRWPDSAALEITEYLRKEGLGSVVLLDEAGNLGRGKEEIPVEVIEAQ